MGQFTASQDPRRGARGMARVHRPLLLVRRLGRGVTGLAVAAACVVAGSAAWSTAAGATSAYNWLPHHPATSPPARTSAAVAYDAKLDTVVVYGGFSEGAPLSTMWAWNGTTWSRQTTGTSGPVTGASMVYYPTCGCNVVFGGYKTGEVTNTTTYWTGGWVPYPSPSTSPPARAYASMAYDPTLGGIVLFGGFTPTGDLSTVWLFRTFTWVNITPASPTTAPTARTTAAVAFDTATQQLVLFGGYYGGAEGTTWVLDGSSTTWTKESPTPAPSPRFDAAMAYDAVAGNLVLFGGSTDSAAVATTWIWTGTAWVQQSPATSPPARVGNAAAYDATTGEVVLLSGSPSAQTWTWQSVSVLDVPGKPTDVVATAGSTTASVRWTAPGTDGGTAITGYTVTSHPGGLTCGTAGTTCTVTGLTNGIEYTFTVTATNNVGTGSPSTPSAKVTPAGKPKAPTGVTAVATDSTLSATVTWTAATSNGSTISKYTVTSSTANLGCSSATASCTVTGLAIDVGYTFTVVATNAKGTSPESTTSNSILIPGKPFAPVTVTANRGNEAASVGWTAPTTDGTAITGYTVTSSPGTLTCTVGGATRGCTVKGLTNGTRYTFTVTATNSVGTSAPSSKTATIVPATVPFAPTNVVAVRGNQVATVTWTAPTTDGTAITGYKVTSTNGTDSCATTGSLTCTVTGLANGQAYSFKVSATNGLGTSTASTASNSVTPATLPSVPGNVLATGGDHSATVSWTASVDNGTAISDYIVTSAPTAKTCSTVTAHTCTVNGLTNGVAYTFTVVAENNVGESATSTPSTRVIPAGPPAPPTNVVAVRESGAATVSWTAATPDGAAVSAYSVLSTPAGASCETTGALTCTVSGLVNGRSYTFAVKATNVVGTSKASAASNAVIPAGIPYTPPTISVTVNPTSVTVTWKAATDNGTALTSYTVLRATPGGTLAPLATVGPSTLTYTDASAVPGTVYTYAVEAVNAIGTGLQSATITGEVPPPPGTGVHFAGLPGGQGYWLVTPTGGVTAFGRAQLHGTLPGLKIGVNDIVGMASTVDGGGYWLVSTQGAIYAFGDAPFFGSLPGDKVKVSNILGIVPTPDGRGYWLFGSDGGIFSFGDAAFFGSTGGLHLNKPVVGMTATPTGMGYWMVASDGGVFSFGRARFHGSTGSLTLNKPIVAMAARPTGDGYWLVASDGGIFCFTVPFEGSTGGNPPSAPVVGMIVTPSGTGYTVVDATGTGFRFPMPT